MFPSRKLVFFISSTSDLQAERVAVQESLRLFEIDGLRFEEWPSMPDEPGQVCLEGVQSSDAIVLILGSSYGSPMKDGLSGTHLEFRHASTINRPIFVFLLKAADRDPRQIAFISEVERAAFRCVEIESIPQLAESVRASVAAEFSRRWKHFEEHPPETASPWGESSGVPAVLILDDRDNMLGELSRRYAARDDVAICAAADSIFARYPDDLALRNIVLQAVVNVAMNGGPVNRHYLDLAIAVWKNDEPAEFMARAGRLYCLGNALYVLKRYDEAIASYRAAVEIHPTFAECWKNLGSAYHDSGDDAQARVAYEQALKIEPRKFEGLYSLATLLIRHLADPATALTYLEAIDTAALGSSHLASVIAWRAEAKLLLQRYADAAADAEESIHVHHEADWTWTAAARVYAQARHSEPSLNVAAIRFWERFVNRFPKAAHAWLELGFLFFSLREERDRQESSRRALIAYDKAIALGIDDPLVWDRTGHLLQEAGRWEEAIERYARAAAGDAASHGYCYAFALRHLERYSEALPFALAAARTHQPDAMSWVLVADCKAKLKDLEGAFEAYTQAIAVDPNYEKAWFDLGGLCWSVGNTELAFRIWNTALLKFPESGEAERLLAFLDDFEQVKEPPEAD